MKLDSNSLFFPCNTASDEAGILTDAVVAAPDMRATAGFPVAVPVLDGAAAKATPAAAVASPQQQQHSKPQQQSFWLLFNDADVERSYQIWCAAKRRKVGARLAICA